MGISSRVVQIWSIVVGPKEILLSGSFNLSYCALLSTELHCSSVQFVLAVTYRQFESSRGIEFCA